MTGTAAARPQRTLTLEITKTCSRKKGLGPRSVKSVITDTQTMSATVEKYPIRSWRTYSPRTTKRSARLKTRYDPSTAWPSSG